MIRALIETLHAEGRFPRARQAKQVRAVGIASSKLPTGRITFLLFDRGRDEPTWVLKVQRRPCDRTRARDEAKLRTALRARLSAATAASLPEVSYREVAGLGMLLEPAGTGRTFGVVPEAARAEEIASDLAGAFSWLGRFQQETREAEDLTVEALLDRARAHLAPWGERAWTTYGAWLQDVAGRVREAQPGAGLPRVHLHGDFFAKNLIQDRVSGTMTVIDWEFTAAAGPATFDPLFYAISSMHLGGPTGLEAPPAFRQAFLEPRSALAQVVVSALKTWATTMEIDAAWLAFGLLLTVIEMSSRTLRTAGVRGSDDHLYLAHLRALHEDWEHCVLWQ